MALGDLTSAAAVEQAMDEYDRLGRRVFLAKYGYSDARWWYVFRRGRRYDSKAIAGRAYSVEYPDRMPLRETGTYTGGEAVVRKLRALGFEVRRAGSDPVESLVPGTEYDWGALGELFGFRPEYLGAAGGMVSRPADNAVLLITHPEGGRSIDYGDYWDGRDLIYTGRGQRGDQKRSGANRDVGDNRRRILVFEHVGQRRLQFLGQVQCVEEWEASAPDADGRPRSVLRFRLRFLYRAPRSSRPGRRSSRPELRPRPFDPNRPPRHAVRNSPQRPPEETLALREKATQGHHRLLAALSRSLTSAGWTALEEIPAAVDLWARDPSGRRVIFEAKTISVSNELHQVRAAIAQLLEYRFRYGSPADELCLVVDQPIADFRGRLLDGLGIPAVRMRGEQATAASALGVVVAEGRAARAG